ncbi:MAG TPA: hypothetical protein DEF07_02545 [Nitrosomonas sp.]|nr:hypothetical protein [Nitrosomonas sp.]
MVSPELQISPEPHKKLFDRNKNLSSSLELEQEQECLSKAQAGKLELLFHQSIPAVAINILTSSGLTIILWETINHYLLLGWYCALIVSTLFRATLFLRYLRVSPKEDAILLWEDKYFYTLLSSSLVWGLGGVWMMSLAPIFYQAIIYSFLLGMSAGALSVYTAMQKFALSTINIILLPASIWLLFQDDRALVIVGMSGLIFLFSCFRATKILTNALHQSFLLNHRLAIEKEKVELMAKTDSLTQLYNRASFADLAEIQVNYCKRYNQPASVIVLDVDHFKKVNDSLGHQAGDLALQHLAKKLRETTRNSDICGRIGGEEFVIFLPNTDQEGAIKIAEKIRMSIESSIIENSDGLFHITASLGIATGLMELKQLIRMADMAMYQAKNSGRNKICHYDAYNK